MTKEEFVTGYARRSGITVEEFNRVLIAEPCDCDYEKCEGWKAVCRVLPEKSDDAE